MDIKPGRFKQIKQDIIEAVKQMDETSKKRITLEIEKNYSDFRTFYKETKEIVYRKLVDAYEDVTKSDDITLTIIGHIDGQPFETDFNNFKSNLELLKTVINPFFEEIEDYEICSRIVKICQNLQNN
jgi:hypothetical protein